MHYVVGALGNKCSHDTSWWKFTLVTISPG